MNVKSLIIFVVVTLGVLLGVGGLLWQFGSAADKPVAEIAGEKKHVQGSGNVTLVEFSDFQCPACLAVQAPLKEILKKYEGKVEFVYRHFPLTNIHKNAQMASYASEAAAIQGKFWEMHDLLFSKQSEWSTISDPKSKFIEYATTLGLDKDKFATDIDSQGVKDLVSVDMLASTRYRLTGTPTFYINGAKVEFGNIEAKLLELTK
jgi:protein-disulfide isomerase